MLSSLKGIIFAEFDHIAGPKVTFQAPEKIISNEVFETIHEYIITKPQLCERVISLNAFDFVFVGYPVIIHGEKYPRNYLLFNTCFIFSEIKEELLLSVQFFVKKLNTLLRDVEIESEFLFNQESKKKLHFIIDEIFSQLVSTGQCLVNVNEANTVHLKIFEKRESPPLVKDHHVPLIKKQVDPNLIKNWDLALQQVVPHINGHNNVKTISKLSMVHPTIVKKCIRHLIYYDVLRRELVDTYQHTNIYTVTPKLANLYVDEEVQNQCLQYVFQTTPKVIPFRTVFRLYSAFIGISVQEFKKDQHSELKFVEVNDVILQRMILFGAMNGFLRRVHEFPLRVDFDPSSSETKAPILDGETSLDEFQTQYDPGFIESVYRSGKCVILLK